MKKYIVVNVSNSVDLETEVNNLLKEGWEVSGSLAVMPGYSLCLWQPMIKEEEKDEESKDN